MSVSTLALAMALATPVTAQTTTSQLTGHVDGASAGTQVVVTDTNTGQRVTTTVDANGDYQIVGLNPSSYTVAIAGRPEQRVRLLLGQTANVDFLTDTAAAGSGDIVVRARRTIREVRTPTVSTSITTAQIENLPQNQRNFLSFAELAPGVSVTRGGNAQVQAGATSSSNTNVLLDNVSLKNPINHGGIFGQNFGLGNPFPQSAIQEYQVQTQNFGAETGQTGSALITAITKTGGADFHGSAFIEWQPRQFIEQPYFDKRNNVPKPTYDRKQFGGELGGPIIPGKLTFYLAGEGTIQNLPGATGVITQPVPGAVADRINVGRNFDFKQGLYFGKLTWFADDENTINLEAFIRRENNLADVRTNATAENGRTILTHQNRYQLDWRHRAGNFLNLFDVAYDEATQSTPSVGTGPQYVISAAEDFSELAFLGANDFNQGDRSKSLTFKDDATLTLDNHTVRFGGQLIFLDLQREVNQNLNGTYYYVNPGANGSFDPTVNVPYGYRINVAPSPQLKAKDTLIGLYAQDEWKPDEHWTLNAGLRWDLETNQNNNNYVTPANIAAALRAYEGWQARGIDPNDYISTGNERKPEYGAFQPRLGFSYDVYGDRDLVIFGGAGRYFDRSLFIEGVIETLTNSKNVVTNSFNGACAATPRPSFCTDPNALRASLQGSGANGGLGGSVFVLRNDTPLPFSDQFDLGIRKRFGEIQTSLTYSHIESHNIFQFVRANFYSNGWYSRILRRDAAGNVTGCTDGGDRWIQDLTPAANYPNCPALNGQLTGFSGKLNRGQSEGSAHYNAIYLTAEKPFTETSRWGFSSALTIQFARTNDAQELNSDEFFNGPAQDVYGNGYVNGVEKWRFVGTGNYRAPYGFTLSGTVNLSSGPSFGHIYNDGLTVPDGAFGYGNLGGVYYPRPFFGYKRIDLRVAKTFKLPIPGEHRVTVDFEAFNIFNWLNRTYSSWGAGFGSNPPLQEDGQVGQDTRSFQVGLKYAF